MRKSLQFRAIVTILAATMLVVALACGGGEDATPTSPPAATVVPTATVAPTATTPAVTAPTATAVAEAEATATAVPRAIYDEAAALTSLPGYKPEWGTPKRGGTVVFSGATSTVEFTHGVHLGWSPWQEPPIYNFLVKVDPWLGMLRGMHPELAESWEVSLDGLTYTFHLRKGVKFHSADSPNGQWAIPLGAPIEAYGAEMTCKDVKISFDFRANPHEEAVAGFRNAMRNWLPNFKGLSCPDGPDGYTAVLELDFPTGYVLAALGGQLPIYNKVYWEWLWASDYHYKGQTKRPEGHLNKLGTGPFMPKSVVIDQGSRSIANPNYFKKGLPLVDQIEGWSIVDPTTKFAAWLTGKVHWYGGGSAGMAPAHVDQTQKKFPDYYVQGTLYQVNTVILNTQKPPFDNPKVRKAVRLAADSEVWRQYRKSGTLEGTILASIMPPLSPFAYTEEELRTWPGFRQPKDQDIAEANRLLDEVYGKGERPGPWTCLTPASQSRQDYCIFMTGQVPQNLGIEMKMEVTDNATYSAKINRCEFIMYATSGLDTNNTLDPSPRLDGYGSSRGGTVVPCSGISNDPAVVADMDRRLEAMGRELDQQKRKEMARALDKELLLENAHQVIFGHVITFLGYRPEVKGGLFHFIGGQRAQQANYERIWLVKKK